MMDYLELRMLRGESTTIDLAGIKIEVHPDGQSYILTSNHGRHRNEIIDDPRQS